MPAVSPSSGSGVGFLNARWTDEASTAQAAGATVTGATLDLTSAATATVPNPSTAVREVRGQAVADQPGTLYLEVSRDSTTWRRIQMVALSNVNTDAATGTVYVGQINHAPVTRYARFVFVNGGTLNTYFHLQSMRVA